MESLGEMVVKIIGDNSQLDSAIDQSKTKTNQFAEILAEGGPLGKGILQAGAMLTKLATNPLVMVTAAVTFAIKTFIDFTKELVEYGAQIQETSERTGLSTKSLQEYKYIAEQTGGSLETITSAVKMMTRGLETNKDTFAKLGIQIKDSGGQFLSTTDIFDNTLKVLGDMTNDTERTNIALKLFGRGALDMVPLLKEGSKGIEELKNKAHDLGLVLSDETIVNAHDFEKATNSLKATWKAYTMSLVSDSLPALKAIADALLNNAKIAASGKEYTAIFQTAQAYKAGKTSVIEYRDSLVALIEWDKKLLASNDNSTEGLLNKAVANKEIEKTTKELATVEASAAYQSELAIKNNTQAKKDNELVTKAMQQAEKETQDAITAAREKATTEYNTALAKINLVVKQGLKTEK